MAEYIEKVVDQTSKLDWAFPFERKGQFPLDRSAVFSSLADATKYATGDGSDERKLGGTSYVGQIISVYEAGEEGTAAVVNAYIITPARGLMKLAATTASGDIASDVADLQGKVATLISDLDTLEAAVAAMYTNEQIDALIEGAKDDRVDGLITSVGTLEENLGKEVERAQAAEKALDDKIALAAKATDVYTKEEVNTTLADYAKTSDVEADIQEASNALTTEINKKVDAEAYAADKKALQDEDAAIRTIAEGARDALKTFLESEEVDNTVNTLKEIQAEIDKMTDATELATALAAKADNTTVEGIETRVKAIEEAPYVTEAQLNEVDGKFANYTNTEALTTLLAGKQDVIPANTYDTYGSAATAKSEAIADAEGKIATAKQEAIDAAAEAAQGKVDALANGAVKANTEAIAAINNAETGILAQAQADATAKANAAKSGAEATAADLYATKEYVGVVPAGKGDTIVEYINKKAEETLAAASGNSTESAASVALALQNYIELNDPKVAQNTTDIAGLSADLTTKAGEINNLQGVVEGHTTKITTLETLTSGHTGTLESHTQSITALNGAVATKAEQTALDAAIADIAKNTGAIKTLNDTTIPAINEAIGTKANAADVYSKTEVDAKIITSGEVAHTADGVTEGIVIANNKITVTVDAYKKSEIDALQTVLESGINANAGNLTVLLGTDKDTDGKATKSVRAIAKEEVAAIVGAAPEALDTLEEIATWIGEDTTGAAAMSATIAAHSDILAGLGGEGEPATVKVAIATAKQEAIDAATFTLTAATAENLGGIKSASGENKVSVSTDGVASVNTVNVNSLVQTEGDTLILNGGSATTSSVTE